MRFPRDHWRRIRTNNPLERRDERDPPADEGGGRVPGWPVGDDAVPARLRHVAGTHWGTRKYLDMAQLREQDQEEAALAAAG